jgi:hypothetical protein
MMNVFKAMPIKFLLLYLYPNLYAVHNIDDTVSFILNGFGEICLIYIFDCLENNC